MLPGEVVDGRFEIVRLAGSGGMGAVYRAHDRSTGETVALKIIPGLAHDDRLLREAQALAELADPAVVRYVAHGVTGDGALYLAMEWLDGEDLATRLSRGRLSTAESLALARRVAQALQAAHERGIIHRDIKPANLFLPAGAIGSVKLLDFGVARIVSSRPSTTRTGSTVGTPGYIAPEQARGAADLDGRADLFSLGCVLVECLTGQEAFSGDDVMALLAKILFAEAPRVGELRQDIPPELDDLVARLLAKNPDERPSSAGALLAELDALSQLPLSARQRSSHRRSLTNEEQIYVSVVVAGAPGTIAQAAAANTLTPEQLHSTDVSLLVKVRPFGARFERLADGTAVCTLVGGGSAIDQAAQAARCALALQEALPGVPVVLATGRAVIAGALPVGEVIERAAAQLRAARMDAVQSGAAAVRAIRIDEVTARLLAGRFDVRAEDDCVVLSGEKREVEAARSLLGRESPFVGRDQELCALDATLAECERDRVARVVLVTAGLGGGKFRLRHEWQKRLRAHEQPPSMLVARGDPMRAGSPFGMLAQLVRDAADVQESDPLLERQQKLGAHVAACLPDSEAQRVTEFLGEIIGAPFVDMWSPQLRAARGNAMLMGDQTRRAFEDWLSVQCVERPLLLVLEDLQWGDLPSVQYVDAALRLLADRPLMVLGLGRPEVRDLFPNLWRERGTTELFLAPLSRNAAARLVREMLGDGATENAVARIVDRAAGNPFFLEELIRAAAAGEDELPETVLAVVQARLDKLDAPTRRALRAASVFGKVFWRGGVALMLGMDATATSLADSLGLLVAREITTRRPQSRFAGDEEYAFRHGVVREAALGMLTERDQEVAHAVAGKWLEQEGETDALVLAEHFERGAERMRAAAWYKRAAEQALEGSDLDAVLARTDRAILCGAEGEVFAALRAIQAEAHGWRGDWKRQKECALEAMKYFTPASPGWYGAVAELARAHGRFGHSEKLVDIAGVLLEWQPMDDARSACAVAAASAAIPLLFAGRTARAEALIARIDALAGVGPLSPVAVAWMHRARAARALLAGDLGTYRLALEDAAAAFEAAGDLRNACHQRATAGYAHIALGAYERAEAILRDARERAARLSLDALEMFARLNLGSALTYRGKLTEGRDFLLDAVAYFKAKGDPRLEGTARTCLAEAHVRAGDLDAARRQAKLAVTALELFPPLRASALSVLADVELAHGERESALRLARDSVRLVDTLGDTERWEPFARLVYARALQAVGEEELARVAIARAKDRLLARAALIVDPGLRASFLESVPENARILDLAGAWLHT